MGSTPSKPSSGGNAPQARQAPGRPQVVRVQPNTRGQITYIPPAQPQPQVMCITTNQQNNMMQQQQQPRMPYYPQPMPYGYRHPQPYYRPPYPPRPYLPPRPPQPPPYQPRQPVSTVPATSKEAPVKAETPVRSSQVSVNVTSTSDSPVPKKPRRDSVLKKAPIPKLVYENLDETPPPKPTVRRKIEIFEKKKYEFIDKRSTQVENSLLESNLEALVKYLTEGPWGDLGKVRAIFWWLTSVDVNDVEKLMTSADSLPSTNTPLDYLCRIKWNKGCHAHLFAWMCRCAQVPCEIITGVNKSSAYTLGEAVQPDKMRGQWNAVYVEDEWHLVDVFWASTCVVGQGKSEWQLLENDGRAIRNEEEEEEDQLAEEEIKHWTNEFYFLTDPSALIYTHLPDDANWQLLSDPISFQDFEKAVYLRERFFEMDLSMNDRSQRQCVLQTTEGEISIEFSFKPKSGLVFMYRISKSLKGFADGDDEDDDEEEEKEVHNRLENFVFVESSRRKIRYTVGLPITGRFKMDIHGKAKRKHEDFKLVSSYIIDCPEAKKKCEPLPDNPEIGYGPNEETEEVGMVPTTHDQAVIETSDGTLEIKFDCTVGVDLEHSLVSNGMDEHALKDYVTTRNENGVATVNVRLPKKGEYALKINAIGEGMLGDVPNVCNYLIRCSNDNPDIKPFPKLNTGILGKDALSDKLGVSCTSHPGGLINTDQGEVTVEFQVGTSIELFCEVHHADVPDEVLQKLLRRRNIDENNVAFDLGLPKGGEYSFNILACRTNENSPRLFNAYNALIVSSAENMDLEEFTDLDAPEGEAVPVAAEPEKKEVVNPKVEYKLEEEMWKNKRITDMFAELRRKNAHDAFDTHQVSLGCNEKGESVVTLEMGKDGEFTLNFFERTQENAITKVQAWTLTKKQPSFEDEPDFVEDAADEEERKRAEYHQLLRRTLKQEMGRDPIRIKELGDAIEEYKNNDVQDPEDYAQKATDLLNFHKAKEDLVSAMKRRHLDDLEKALSQGAVNNLNHEMDKLLELGTRIFEELTNLDLLKKEVDKLNQKTIAEIKAYNHPSNTIHQIMIATFMLLGHDEKELQSWQKVRALLAEHVKEKIKQFDVTNLTIDTALNAKKLLEGFELEKLKEVSVMIATFFAWCKGVIRESITRVADQELERMSNQAKPIVGEVKTSRKIF
ncbi:uncharacterized protein LOC106158364 isoform X2 [Lingula anatina]|uniref:Uncharacterized protein LOC106158364 isoform X1 n=1 Tax=Lingula anatina TaxID=7574 RepID=A0A1S3HXF6_LINAN|nr:uncharacterized protein LOC106158364 isoform X1 [Lingula anatina]XP_013389754.1 uncharacterized protein LOC106158364 isoform X2 [Lingula anatina]|eukprot:XP_013389753.1 uncharacterized protein LOC106158364 isoform X1 [Lingula anatina]